MYVWVCETDFEVHSYLHNHLNGLNEKYYYSTVNSTVNFIRSQFLFLTQNRTQIEKWFVCSWNLLLFSDPNTQILYACDSCGDKFLDASSLAQHVRIHTAQALVMFQADSDFYQYTAATTAKGDSTATWQPTPEQVIHEGELIFRAQVGEGETEDGMIGEAQEQEESEQEVQEKVENGQVETTTEIKTYEKDVEEDKEQEMECERQS